MKTAMLADTVHGDYLKVVDTSFGCPHIDIESSYYPNIGISGD